MMSFKRLFMWLKPWQKRENDRGGQFGAAPTGLPTKELRELRRSLRALRMKVDDAYDSFSPELKAQHCRRLTTHLLDSAVERLLADSNISGAVGSQEFRSELEAIVFSLFEEEFGMQIEVGKESQTDRSEPTTKPGRQRGF